MSKYFVTFETTIWYLWELRLSRECPVREASPSDASGVVSRLATTIKKFLALEKYELQNEEELPVAMVRKKPG